MIIAGISLMAIAVALTGASIIVEIYQHEPVWGIFMKIGAGLLGIGGVVFGVALAT